MGGSREYGRRDDNETCNSERWKGRGGEGDHKNPDFSIVSASEKAGLWGEDNA
jgi:hypothetical protein